MKLFNFLTLIGGACLLAFSAVGDAKTPDARPNIVMFLTDDQGGRDLEPYGDRTLRTPHMQKLAHDGLAFDNAYVASPTCAPSRGALLTGLMPARNGAEPNHAKPRPEIKKWPAYFHDLGYEVVAFGKVSHYKHTADYGFDYFAHDTFHDHAGIGEAAAFMTNRLQNANRKPLCIFVGSNWPHVPWPETDLGYSPEDLPLPAGTVDTEKTRQWRARYAAAVTAADRDLGMIREAARACLGTNTIFMYSSDNGAQWPFAKWNCYEAGIKTPLIVSWPGVVKPGSRTKAFVSWVDFLPTLVEAAGGKAPSDIDGKSFLKVLQGKKQAHRSRIYATHSGDGRFNIYPIRSLRVGQWKYIRNLHPEYAFTTHIDLPVNLGQRDYFETWEAAGKSNSLAKAIVERYHARSAEELYNLSLDPDETNNLAGNKAQASRLKQLRAEMDKWLRAQGDTGKVYNEPRLLGDPASYGAHARMGKQ